MCILCGMLLWSISDMFVSMIDLMDVYFVCIGMLVDNLVLLVICFHELERYLICLCWDCY